MKAVVYDRYGPPDVLDVVELEKPVPGHGEVLLEVFAASVNSWDWDMLTGTPYEYRLLSGLLKPGRTRILGCDVAGRVEAVGENVSKFKPGDEVYGDLSAGSWGGFAEYTCANEAELSLKPGAMSFEQAAATPQASLLALQALRKKEDLNAGDKILINGGCGGVGTFAIQMAKAAGLEITAVDSDEKLDVAKSLGADHVIDYWKADFTRHDIGYDLILDVRSNRSVFAYRRALGPNGVYASVGGKSVALIQLALLGPLIKRIEGKVLTLVIHQPNLGLDVVGELFESGTVAPVIDRCFPLDQTADALRYFGEGHFKGKIVITMGTKS